MEQNGKKSEQNHKVSKKDIELISRLSTLCDKYNYTILEALIELKKIKKEAKGE